MFETGKQRELHSCPCLNLLKNTTDSKVLEEKSLYRSVVQRPLLSELLTVISVAIFVSSLFSYLKTTANMYHYHAA